MNATQEFEIFREEALLIKPHVLYLHGHWVEIDLLKRVIRKRVGRIYRDIRVDSVTFVQMVRPIVQAKKHPFTRRWMTPIRWS